MSSDDELRVARQLMMLLADRRLFEQLEDAYCRLRHRLPPTAALDGALAEMLPTSEHEGIAVFLSRAGEPAQSHDSPPPIHHSVIDALEERCEERHNSERHERRDRMGVAELAADVAADAQLAAAYEERDHDATAWLERFPSMVLGRASHTPTATGRRLLVDQALKTLLAMETDYQERGGDDAAVQVAWCVALSDGLIAASQEQGKASAGLSFPGGASDAVDDRVATGPETAATTIPRPPILHVLRSAMSSLDDESAFSALIEAANGHDDNYDPADTSTLEAMKRLLEEEAKKSLLEDEALQPGESIRTPASGRLRDELWTHLVWGFRVGSYLLTTHRRRPSPVRRSPSYATSDLISYVDRARRREEVADIISDPDVSAALHYHALSSTLLAAVGVDRTQARRWVRLVEDLGFLTALGAEDLASGPVLELEEARVPAAGRVS